MKVVLYCVGKCFVYVLIGNVDMAAVNGYTPRVGCFSATKSRQSQHRIGSRSTDAVVELNVSSPTATAYQSASLPPLSTRLHAAVSQGLVDTAAELLNCGVILGPDKVICILVYNTTIHENLFFELSMKMLYSEIACRYLD